MAYKETKKFSEATVWDVKKHALTGVIIQMRYEIEGTKHTTDVTHDFLIPFCDMRHIGGRFHKIMDELSKEWHDTKEEISGRCALPSQDKIHE